MKSYAERVALVVYMLSKYLQSKFSDFSLT